MEQSTQDVMEAEVLAPATQPLPPSVSFTKVDNNLTGIGFFSASSKRSRKATKKTTMVSDGGIERRIDILPSAEYGLPITQDQDYWLALMKLVSDHLQREGKLTNPFTFSTAELRHILGQSNAGKNYQAVQEWADVMSFTGIKGGAYNAVSKKWIIDRTHVVERFVTVGKELPDGTIAEKNHVWFSQWQLDNINAGNLIPIELATYTQLQNNISRNLVPHLQEWLFASQRDGRFEKQYEDICQLLGVRVYHYRSDIERQLQPSLDELLAYGYLAKWAIEPMANRKTYKLVLWHGHKYHRDQQHRIERKHRSNAITEAGENGHARERRPRQKPLLLTPEVDHVQLEALTSRGVSESASRKVLADLPPDFAVLDTLEWGDQQIATQRGKIQNPPGFYISLLRDRTSPPPTFETSRQRKTREEAEAAKRQAILKAQEGAERQRGAVQQKADQLFATLSPEDQAELERQVKADLKGRHPKVNWDAAGAVHEGTIRAGIRRLVLERAFAADLQSVLATPQLSGPMPLQQLAAQPPTGSPSVDSVVAHPRTMDKPVD